MDEQKEKRKKYAWTPEHRANYQKAMAERERRKAEALAQGLELKKKEHPPKSFTGKGNAKAYLNLPNRVQLPDTDENREMVSRIIGEARLAYKQPKPATDEELERRLDEYWKFCEERVCVPTVEEMCMYLGYCVSAISKMRTGVRNGLSARTKDILDRAYSFIGAIDSKLAVQGKIRDAVYIFRAKNFYDMKDQQELTVSGANDNTAEMSKDDLEQWFLEDGKKVETSFKEDEA